MKLQQTTPLSEMEEVVDLDSLRDHLRIEDNEQDAYLYGIIQASRSAAEEYINGIIVDRSYRYLLDSFPREIELPVRPVDVDSIQISYIDPDGNSQTVDSFNHSSNDYKTVIFADPGENWPETQNVKDAVTITFDAGYAAAKGEVPAAIKHAILMIGATLHALPQDHIAGGSVYSVPTSSQFLMQPFRKDPC